jgi:hypothetical protein
MAGFISPLDNLRMLVKPPGPLVTAFIMEHPPDKCFFSRKLT